MIFSVGVLMVIGLSDSLSRTMSYSARSSKIVVMVNERLDSLQSEPFDSLAVGSSSDTVSVMGVGYDRTASVTLITAILKRIDVSMTPASSGSEPRYAATTYVATHW